MCWNISAAEEVPKFNRLYRLSPLWVAKVVMYRDSGARTKAGDIQIADRVY